MTRAEIRIEAAKKRAKEAEARMSRAYENQRAAIEAATKKHSPRVWAANRAVAEARQAVTIAELAARGITPMKTIILWHPKYTGVTEQRRYVVRVTREGWTRLVPVGKTGVILKNRADQNPPYSTRQWSMVTVTDQELGDEP